MKHGGVINFFPWIIYESVSSSREQWFNLFNETQLHSMLTEAVAYIPPVY